MIAIAHLSHSNTKSIFDRQEYEVTRAQRDAASGKCSWFRASDHVRNVGKISMIRMLLD